MIAASRWLRVLIVALVLADLAAIGVEFTRDPQPAAATTIADGSLAGSQLYSAPNTAGTAQSGTGARSDAAGLSFLAAEPQAVWLTGGSPSSAAATVRPIEQSAAAAGAVPSFVVYDIPHRDCGGESSGGATNGASYKAYVRAIARQLGSTRTIVVLEPDALAGMDCLSTGGQAGRLRLLSHAVKILSARPGALVYLDAGNEGWQSASTMAERLIHAGIVNARGFSLNVSNFDPTASEISYGRSISSLTGWKHFVVDTSRNGAAKRPHTWCNPRGARIGQLPGTPAHDRAVDALLWIQHPGESDGTCGASRDPAGTFDLRLARELLAGSGH